MNPDGVDKEKFFQDLSLQRHPEADKEAQKQGFKHLQGEWKKDGLQLSERKGSLGNSFDAQRLILLARKQGREDQMIEAIYTANHENNLCLSNVYVLLACAEKAGIQGAEEMLRSDEGHEEVFEKIQSYRAMGITSVPTLIFNDKYSFVGAPERRMLEAALKGLVENGDNVVWPPELPPVEIPEFVNIARTLIGEASENDRHEWSHKKLDWSDTDPRWKLLEEQILKNSKAKKTFGTAIDELREMLRREVGPVWNASDDLAIKRPAEASSAKSPERAASFAVDGDSETRWTSAYKDEQWLSVDLGAVSELSHIEICWEAAHAKSYLLQGSDDGTTWTTWTSEVGHEGWIKTLLPAGTRARWVRMFGQERATGFGFSIWALRVFAPKE